MKYEMSVQRSQGNHFGSDVTFTSFFWSELNKLENFHEQKNVFFQVYRGRQLSGNSASSETNQQNKS